MTSKTSPLRADAELGQIFAFRTTPFTAFSAADTGRFASLKVIGVSPSIVVVGVLDGVWTHRPILEEAHACGILLEHRFLYAGRECTFGVLSDWWRDARDSLLDFGLLGTGSVSLFETCLSELHLCQQPGNRYAPLSSASVSAEGEWRWANDRDQLIAEQQSAESQREADRLVSADTAKRRLRTLTWDLLLAGKPFARWSPSPPFPPCDFTDAATRVIREACHELQSLGPNPRRADVRRVLKQTVEWFNAASEAAGDVIETEEREDILAILSDMAHVAHQPGLIVEIESWREW